MDHLGLHFFICGASGRIAVSLDLLPTPSQVRNLMTPKAERQLGPSERDDAFGSRKRVSFYESCVCSCIDVLRPSMFNLLSKSFSSRPPRRASSFLLLAVVVFILQT